MDLFFATREVNIGKLTEELRSGLGEIVLGASQGQHELIIHLEDDLTGVDSITRQAQGIINAHDATVRSEYQLIQEANQEAVNTLIETFESSPLDVEKSLSLTDLIQRVAQLETVLALVIRQQKSPGLVDVTGG